jgi:microcystin-dependent protein
VGAIFAVPYATPDTGYLECNGALISRTTYAALYAKLGDTISAGDGTTTFGIPNMRGQFIRGWDNGAGVDAGRAIGTSQNDELKSHTHQLNGSGGSSGPQNAVAIDSNSGTRNGMVLATGGTETRPKNVAMMYQIKVV